MAVIHINKEAFVKHVWDFTTSKEWKFLGNKPAILDFYASWCGPCRMISPILDELSEEYKGKIDIYKIDVDEENELASVFGVSSIPTLLFCGMTGEPKMARGALPKEQFREIIDGFLL